MSVHRTASLPVIDIGSFVSKPHRGLEQLIIEDVSGEPFAAFMEREVAKAVGALEPGMGLDAPTGTPRAPILAGMRIFDSTLSDEKDSSSRTTPPVEAESTNPSANCGLKYPVAFLRTMTARANDVNRRIAELDRAAAKERPWAQVRRCPDAR